jgi:hypothetical protein
MHDEKEIVSSGSHGAVKTLDYSDLKCAVSPPAGPKRREKASFGLPLHASMHMESLAENLMKGCCFSLQASRLFPDQPIISVQVWFNLSSMAPWRQMAVGMEGWDDPRRNNRMAENARDDMFETTTEPLEVCYI